MKYFVLDCEGECPAHTIGKRPRLPGGPWYHGQKIQIEVPNPLHYELDVEYENNNCNMKAMFNREALPLMHSSLIRVLQSAGVNNLELFPASIANPNTGDVYKDYYTFNIIGLVAAADMNLSTLMQPNSSPSMLDTDFESLVIDEKNSWFSSFPISGKLQCNLYLRENKKSN